MQTKQTLADLSWNASYAFAGGSGRLASCALGRHTEGVGSQQPAVAKLHPLRLRASELDTAADSQAFTRKTSRKRARPTHTTHELNYNA